MTSQYIINCLQYRKTDGKYNSNILYDGKNQHIKLTKYSCLTSLKINLTPSCLQSLHFRFFCEG